MLQWIPERHNFSNVTVKSIDKWPQANSTPQWLTWISNTDGRLLGNKHLQHLPHILWVCGLNINNCSYVSVLISVWSTNEELNERFGIRTRTIRMLVDFVNIAVLRNLSTNKHPCQTLSNTLSKYLDNQVDYIFISPTINLMSVLQNKGENGKTVKNTSVCISRNCCNQSMSANMDENYITGRETTFVVLSSQQQSWFIAVALC